MKNRSQRVVRALAHDRASRDQHVEHFKRAGRKKVITSFLSISMASPGWYSLFVNGSSNLQLHKFLMHALPSFAASETSPPASPSSAASPSQPSSPAPASPASQPASPAPAPASPAPAPAPKPVVEEPKNVPLPESSQMLERTLLVVKPGYSGDVLDAVQSLLKSNDFVVLGKLEGRVLSAAEAALLAGGDDHKDDVAYLTRYET